VTRHECQALVGSTKTTLRLGDLLLGADWAGCRLIVTINPVSRGGGFVYLRAGSDTFVTDGLVSCNEGYHFMDAAVL
jgi:hypothetical protein